MKKVDSKMFVLKRDGRKEPVLFDKITSRIQKLCYGLNMEYIDPPSITLKVINGLYPGIHTVELDSLAAETAVMLSNEHPDYALLAARIEVSNLHKETKKLFSDVTEELYLNSFGLSENYYKIVKENADRLNSAIIYDRDFYYTYFGFKILETNYLKQIDGKVVERPQHMLMRVAVTIHEDDIDSVIDTYNLLSEKWYMHTPLTMSCGGFAQGQLFSGYSLSMSDDSIEGIFGTLRRCGTICRFGGKAGFDIHRIRSTGSYICGTNGTSNGIVPMLRVYNSFAMYTHQGRKTETANLTVYLEPWHSDIFEFLNLKKKEGKTEMRARELSYGLWIPDLFMKRVENDGDWCLMCPYKCPNLFNTWGKEFEKIYESYENEGRYNRKVKARQLWYAILESQMETGLPAMLFKDNCNRKTNHQNIGTIKSSNFSAELCGATTDEEVFCCSSAIVSLDMYVKADNKSFDFQKLKEVVKQVTFNLDKMIDKNWYSIKEAKISANKNRPIAIGVQGLADTFIKMRYPYDSNEAKLLNKQIFETIYYGSLEASCEMAKNFGPYESYPGSPVSKGLLQYDMWNVVPTDLHNWDSLKVKISNYGIRNSLLMAAFPTPSIARILGCNEGINAIKSNIYDGKVSIDGFKVINSYLLNDLAELGLWDEQIERRIINNNGSIQDIESIPDNLKSLYKTAWELPQKIVMQMAADRGAFIDQSQSLNIHLISPNYGKLTSMHFYAWNLGLKTGMYYLHSKDTEVKKEDSMNVASAKNPLYSDIGDGKAMEALDINGHEKNMAELVCSLENKDDCLMCGS